MLNFPFAAAKRKAATSSACAASSGPQKSLTIAVTWSFLVEAGAGGAWCTVDFPQRAGRGVPGPAAPWKFTKPVKNTRKRAGGEAGHT
jgi:hypothetical protein